MALLKTKHRRPERRPEATNDCLAAVTTKDTRCTVCGHLIHAPASVARGIGPKCHRRNRQSVQDIRESGMA